MAGEGKFGLLSVPDFAAGMSSYMRIGATADDEYTWRDHTDGNRITTTRGDKVEIIRGTYELQVQGRRRHESGASADHEGKVFQSGITYRGKIKFDGPNVVEETVKGDVDSTFYGDTTDKYYGNRVESHTGTESPGTELERNPGIIKENPEIESRTWAKKIESYTGSSALPVPSIKQETWVEKMESSTHVTSTTDETVVTGAMSSTTTIKSIVSSTTADSTRDETKVSGTIESETTATKLVSVTHGDSDTTTYGDSVSYQKGDTNSTVEGIENTINYKVVDELVLGMMNDVTIGATTGLTAGVSLSVKIAAEASITVGASVEIELAKLQLGATKTHLHLNRTKAVGASTNVAAVTLFA